MASLKNGFRPSLMTLEGREQPGSMFSTGLDGASSPAPFGEEILKASRPALVNNQAPTENRQHGNHLAAGIAAVERARERHDHPAGRNAVHRGIDGLSDRRVFASLGEYVRWNPGAGATSRRFRRHARRRSAQLQRRLRFVNGLANEFNTIVSDARTFDGFRIRGGQTKDCFFSHNLVQHGNVDRQRDDPRAGLCHSRTFRTAGFRSCSRAFTCPPPTLPPDCPASGSLNSKTRSADWASALPHGHYYVNVQPIGNGTGRSFNSTTAGLAASRQRAERDRGRRQEGRTGTVGDSYFDSPFFGYVFEPAENLEGVKTDFSMGVCRARVASGGFDPKATLL